MPAISFKYTPPVRPWFLRLMSTCVPTHTHTHPPTHHCVRQSLQGQGHFGFATQEKETSEAFKSLNVFAVEKIYETATVECANFIKISHHRAIIRYINISNLIPSNKDCRGTLCMKSDILMTFNPLQMKNTRTGAPPSWGTSHVGLS